MIVDLFLYAFEKLLLESAHFIHRARLLLRKPPQDFPQPLRLDLGCGGRKRKGFIGIDAALGPGVDIKHRLETGILFADNSIKEIFSSHFLEHLPHQKVPFILDECFRVLQKNGKLTLEVPDLAKSMLSFLKMDEEKKWRSGWEWIFGNQKKSFEFHQTGFTKQRLRRLLKKTGFIKIKVKQYQDGPIPSLKATALKP